MHDIFDWTFDLLVVPVSNRMRKRKRSKWNENHIIQVVQEGVKFSIDIHCYV